MKSFAVQTTIAATPEAVWDLLTDAPSYPSWNSTVARVDSRIALGETVTVHVTAAPGRAFPVKVVASRCPIAWRRGMPFGLFEGERAYELRSAISGGVELTMHEEHTGLLAPLITKSIPNLQPAFDEFASCLKARAEAA